MNKYIYILILLFVLNQVPTFVKPISANLVNAYILAVLPNPAGVDNGNEWVKIFVPQSAIGLEYKININSNSPYSIIFENSGIIYLKNNLFNQPTKPLPFAIVNSPSKINLMLNDTYVSSIEYSNVKDNLVTFIQENCVITETDLNEFELGENLQSICKAVSPKLPEVILPTVKSEKIPIINVVKAPSNESIYNQILKSFNSKKAFYNNIDNKTIIENNPQSKLQIIELETFEILTSQIVIGKYIISLIWLSIFLMMLLRIAPLTLRFLLGRLLRSNSQ